MLHFPTIGKEKNEGSVMKTMKAYVTQTFGAEARFETAEIPIPDAKPRHIIIEVKATSINPIDNKFFRHDIGFNPQLPAVLHGDVAGIVSEIGTEVESFEVGDEVYACAGGFKGTAGALADFMPADSRLVAKKPTSLSFAEAAALPLVAITAWESLIDAAKIQAGEHVLVHGGTGGVGHVGIQLAKAKEAQVSTTVSSKAKADMAIRLGADHTILYHEESVEEYVQRLTNGVGFDAVYDTVGGATFDQSLKATRKWGRIAALFTGTDSPTKDLLPAFLNGLTIHTENMSIPLVTGEGRPHHGEILRAVAKLVDEGKLTPLIHEKRFTFDEVNEAHALFEAKSYTGKIVLTR